MECSRWAAPGLRGLPVSHQEVTCRLRARLGECCRQTGRSFGDEPPDCSCSSSIRPWWWYDLKRLGILKIFFGRRGSGGKKNVASYKLFNAFMEQYESSFLPGVPLYILCLGKQHQRNRAPECSTFSTSQRAFLRFYECWCLNVSPSRHLKYQVCLIDNNRALVVARSVLLVDKQEI